MKIKNSVVANKHNFGRQTAFRTGKGSIALQGSANSIQQSTDKKQENAPVKLFDNLKEILKPEEVASLLGVSVKTIYDWRYRGTSLGVPKNLFLKFNRFIYLRSDILRDWFISQNP